MPQARSGVGWLVLLAVWAGVLAGVLNSIIPGWTLTVPVLLYTIGDPRTAWPRLKGGLRQRLAATPRLDPDYRRTR